MGVIQKMNGFNWCHGSLVKRDIDMNTWYNDRDARESDCDWMCSQNSKCACSWFSTQAGGTCEQYGQHVLYDMESNLLQRRLPSCVVSCQIIVPRSLARV